METNLNTPSQGNSSFTTNLPSNVSTTPTPSNVSTTPPNSSPLGLQKKGSVVDRYKPVENVINKDTPSVGVPLNERVKQLNTVSSPTQNTRPKVSLEDLIKKENK